MSNQNLNSSAVSVGNGGTIQVSMGGAMNLENAGLRVESGGTLAINNGSLNATSLTQEGNFIFSSGQVNIDGGAFTKAGFFDLSGDGTGDLSFSLKNGATTVGLTSLTIGNVGSVSKQFNILAGSKLTTSANSVIGTAGSNSQMRVSGAGSTWNSGGIVSVGDGGSGTLIVENGGHLVTNISNATTLQTGIAGAASNGNLIVQSGGQVDAGFIELSRVAGSNSTATFTGSGSQVNSTGLFVGGGATNVGGTAALTIADGAEVNVNGTARVRAAGTLNLNGGSLTTNTFIRDSTGIFNFNGGTMKVLGTYSNGSGTVTLAGSGVNDNPNLVLEGNASASGITALNVGSTTRQGTLTLNQGSQLSTGVATIASRGTVNLNGGNLLVSSLANNGILNWNSGAVRYTTSATLDSATLTGLLGSAHNLRDNQTLGSIGGTMTLGSAVNVNGGTLAPTNLTNNSTLTLNQGNVQVAGTFNNNAGRTVQVNGVSDLSATSALNNSGVIRMNSSTASMSSNQITNNAGGTISGTGQINGNFDNFGTVRAAGSENLVFTGGTNRNVMNMNIAGGTVEFTESFSNRNGAAITGRGSLITSSSNPGGLGLTNDGLMSFSAGTMDIFGDVDQTSGGRIVTSGGGVTTFFDDVIHNGEEIRTFLGSRTVFLGDQTGAGNFTGTGVVEYAGDLRPGNSPASISYEGDVLFNSSVNSFFELGGLAAGEFDQLLIDGNFELAGDLSVSLINGFELTDNDLFLIADIGGNLTGQFSGLGEGSLIGNFGGMNLFITYSSGNGNDIALFASAVPEPSAGLAMICFVACLGLRRRRQN